MNYFNNAAQASPLGFNKTSLVYWRLTETRGLGFDSRITGTGPIALTDTKPNRHPENIHTMTATRTS